MYVVSGEPASKKLNLWGRISSAAARKIEFDNEPGEFNKAGRQRNQGLPMKMKEAVCVMKGEKVEKTASGGSAMFSR